MSEGYWNERTYKERTPFEKLVEFHEAFELGFPESPELPEDIETRKLRIRILVEEFEEYLEGEENNDIIEIADALIDIIYVAYGTGVEYGLPMDKLFNEVHRSNMSKLDENGNPIYREDGKVMKGENYTPPKVKEIIEEHINGDK